MHKKLQRSRIFLFLIVITTHFLSPALKLPVYAASTARIHYLTLPGSTEAILLECNGQFGMVDSGEDSDYPDGSNPAYPLRPGIVKGDGYENVVIDYLKSVGVTQDNFEFYIGTHPHSDHIGSADEIIRTFHPKRVYIQEYKDSYISYETNLWDNLYVYDQMLEAAAEVDATIIQDFSPDAPLYPDKVSVKGTILWDDQKDADHCRPHEVTVTLLDPITNKEQTLFVSPDEDENWTYQFDNLQKYNDDKIPIIYDVTLSVLEDYEITRLDSGYDFLCLHVPTEPEPPEESDTSEELNVPEEPDISNETSSSEGAENTEGSEEPETPEKPANSEELGENSEEPEEWENPDELENPEKPETQFRTDTIIETSDILFSEGGIFDTPFESNDDPGEESDHMFTDAIPLRDQVDPTCPLDPNNIDQSDITEYIVQAQEGIFYDLKEVQDTTSTPNFTLGNDMEIQIKHYGGDYKTNPKPDANYFSLGVLVKCNGKSAFLAGDINNYEGAETALAEELGHVDILTLGHHGYYGSNTSGYLTALSPSIMVCAGGCYLIPNANEYDSLSTLLEMGKSGGVPLYPTAWYHDYTDALVFDFNDQLSNNIPSSVSWLAVTGNQDFRDYIHYLDGLPTPYTGWFDYSGTSYYFNNSCRIARDEWILMDHDTCYYFDQSGLMDKNWIKRNGQKYCVDSHGNIKTGWQFIDKTWYYMDSCGAMTTGWQKVNNQWYYMDPDGIMLTGWQKISNSWYYMNPGGSMATGWKKVNNNWYYMNSNGIMLTGWQKISSNWYYMNPGGSMTTGWQKINDNWYYMNSSGSMVTGWQKVNGIWYYMNSSGAMLTGWQKVNGIWYYMNSSGAMLTGWQKVNGNWYYMSSSGAMLTGWQKISGYYYYMYSSGEMAANTYIHGYYVNKSGVWIP